MAKQITAPLPQNVKPILKQITSADGNNYVDLFAANLGLGKNLQALQAVSRSANGKRLLLAVNDGAATVQLVSWQVAANLGNDGVTSGLDLMAIVAAWIGRHGLLAKPVKLMAKVTVALAAGETIDFYGEYMDLDDAA